MHIEKAAPRIGAIVTGVDVKSLSDSEWKGLYQSWLDSTVLIVRDQKLTKADYVAYSARSNMYAAYDALPQRLKERIEPLKIEFGYGGRARTGIELLDPEDQKRPPAVHSMVRVHPETGRKSLYVNPFHIIRVQGMPEAEGDRLLAELYWYMLQPNAEYRHKWRAGDIVIWDNRCSIHSAAGGNPADERRVHWRTTIMQ
jgi:taurine dioxygenase